MRAKVVAFEEQRFSGNLGEAISEAIAEVQLRRMSASFTEVPVGFPRNPGLPLSDGFDREFPDTKQVVEAAAGDRVAVSRKFAAETRLLVALSMALAQSDASGSARRMVRRADESTIIVATRCRIEQVAMLGGTEWLLQAGSAVLANRQQDPGKTRAVLAAQPVEPLAHSFGNRRRQGFSGDRRQILHQALRLGIRLPLTHLAKIRKEIPVLRADAGPPGSPGRSQ